LLDYAGCGEDVHAVGSEAECTTGVVGSSGGFEDLYIEV
jgi:hypothetical protein